MKIGLTYIASFVLLCSWVPQNANGFTSTFFKQIHHKIKENSNNNNNICVGTTTSSQGSMFTTPMNNKNKDQQVSFNNIHSFIHHSYLTFVLSCTILLTTIATNPQIASAADYGSLSDEQKAVAEAWRIVDNNYIDRTFNNQDWFQLRQDAVKKKYKSNQEALDAIDKLVSSLGDKYTRYLPPAKFGSLVDAATGTLAGVGVELSMDKDTGKIYASDIEPSSPAFKGEYCYN